MLAGATGTAGLVDDRGVPNDNDPLVMLVFPPGPVVGAVGADAAMVLTAAVSAAAITLASASVCGFAGPAATFKSALRVAELNIDRRLLPS